MAGLKSLWATLVFTALCLPPGSVHADDIYAYEKDGQIWFTNEGCPRGAKKCRLVMKGWTSSGSSSATEGQRKSRPSKSWTPPSRDTVDDDGEDDETPPKPASRRVVTRKDIDDTIREASKLYDIPEAFIRAIIEVESSYKVKALSYKGAMGLMQLMPGTARDMGVTDPWDPYQNIMGGTRLLRILANRFDGDIPKVIAAYHAGGGAVNEKGGIPFQGTDGYVRKVLDHYYRIKQEMARHPAEASDEPEELGLDDEETEESLSDEEPEPEPEFEEEADAS